MLHSIHRLPRSIFSTCFRLSIASSVLLFAGCGSDEPAKAAGPEIKTEEQRISYGIGYNIGTNLSQQPGLTVDQAAFHAGIADAIAGSKMRVDEKEIQAAFASMESRMNEASSKAATANLSAAEAYLAKNKTVKGVTTTASGLQYEVISAGMGRRPSGAEKVEVHYHGTLLDGTVFDSSVQRGQTIEFAVNGVIPGWTEALQLMPVGSKWKLTIPPQLAYGPADRGKIPPNSALIFEVELIAIK